MSVPSLPALSVLSLLWVSRVLVGSICRCPRRMRLFCGRVTPHSSLVTCSTITHNDLSQTMNANDVVLTTIVSEQVDPSAVSCDVTYSDVPESIFVKRVVVVAVKRHLFSEVTSKECTVGVWIKDFETIVIDQIKESCDACFENALFVKALLPTRVLPTLLEAPYETSMTPPKRSDSL